jgi:very-short-patch-repair endonuclease
MVRRRLGGMLRPHLPGVYLVGFGPPPRLAHEAAALLACRPRALLSGRTAGRLARLPVGGGNDPIEVTVVGRARRDLPGIRVRSIGRLPRRELRHHEGLAVTAASLTLLDIAGFGDEDELARCLNEARILRIVTDSALRATLRAHPNRRGSRALRAALEAERGPMITRSEAELLALRVMRRHGLEPDASDVRIGRFRADFVFRAARVVVEIDGYRYHAGRARFVSDRRRTAELAARGWLVFPLTWADLQTPGPAMRRLAATLHSRTPTA